MSISVPVGGIGLGVSSPSHLLLGVNRISLRF